MIEKPKASLSFPSFSLPSFGMKSDDEKLDGDLHHEIPAPKVDCDTKPEILKPNSESEEVEIITDKSDRDLDFAIISPVDTPIPPANYFAV